MRLYIDKGEYIQASNAVHEARPLGRYGDCVIIASLAYPLTDESGKPATGNFQGKGTIVSRDDGHKYIILGDLQWTATLTEYRIADKPTAESEKSYNDTVAGIKAAIGDFKIGRRLSSKGHDWLEGYDEALRYRKANS